MESRNLLQVFRISIVHPNYNTHTATMSRFFTAGDSSSESSSSDEEELYSDPEAQKHSEEESSSESESEEEEEGSGSGSDDDDKTGVNKFLRDQESSEESEDEEKVTVVKSAKDKRLEEIEGVVKLIDNARKIGDWNTISTGTTVTWPEIPKC